MLNVISHSVWERNTWYKVPRVSFVRSVRGGCYSLRRSSASNLLGHQSSGVMNFSTFGFSDDWREGCSDIGTGRGGTSPSIKMLTTPVASKSFLASLKRTTSYH